MWHAQIPIPIADQCFSDSSSYSGILFILQKDRRKFHDVINEHATRRDAKTISSSLRNVLGNVRVAFEDDRREGDTSYSAIAFGICLESHESGRERSWSERKLLGSARSREGEDHSGWDIVDDDVVDTRKREKRIKREKKGEGANKCDVDISFIAARVQVQLRFARACSRIGRTAQRLCDRRSRRSPGWHLHEIERPRTARCDPFCQQSSEEEHLSDATSRETWKKRTVKNALKITFKFHKLIHKSTNDDLTPRFLRRKEKIRDLKEAHEGNDKPPSKYTCPGNFPTKNCRSESV
ncbi:hypothetical protein G5I_04257 [Acromyrmex echinatior]|uniref:Uncharacterized protein n=1 Tax=Acromyrmex echinatior TaxID=103372 RepID=F4WF51_ACREC|nr:hypothetical protein G5I_04257 [Acromyrmex echinatior]